MNNLFSNTITLLDGGLGTMLQARGLEPGGHPEAMSIEQPEVVEQIHKEYVAAGADVVCTNTFGANAFKLNGTGYTPRQVIEASVRAARAACAGTNARVALDIGPIGELLAPVGSLSFEQAYELFREQAVAGEQAGADYASIETMTDLYEVKAAVLAIKENTHLPVSVTMTFEENLRTFAGCSVSAMALTLTGLGVDAIGVNCSLGPNEIYPIVEKMARWTHLPLIVKPNAGLPDPLTGEYDITAEQFAAQMERYLALGVSAMGGCCGTTPEYIRCLVERVKGKKIIARTVRPRAALCTPTKTVAIDGVRVIGERINPTGKKRFKQALLENDMDYILTQGISQAEAGAHILDVNVGLPGIDEPAMMEQVICRLQAVTDLPLQIDSSNPDAVERGLRAYNGKPIVNSVNGEQKSLEAILPLVKKYGAAVVGLTLDEGGIPDKAEDRVKIAARIVKAAEQHGIPREDVYIDCLTLTASVQQEAVQETLKAVELVKTQLGVKTVLGVSNISFGLPNRELINHSFLLLALSRGLDMPILNPNAAAMMDAIRAFRVLYSHDIGAVDYVEAYHLPEGQSAAVPAPAEAAPPDVGAAIARGMGEDARRITKALLAEQEALDIVNTALIPALDVVGARFEKGELFLPQLLSAAQAAQCAFDVIKEHIAASGKPSVSKGKIVLATVKGDIHDIGKNIVKVILENYGYTILDLGRDVPIQTVVDTVLREDVSLLGLSALMTTTLASMEQTIQAVKREKPDCRIFVGGAVLTADYAARIGADFYARDAKQSADIAKQVLGQ